jgi:predicted enzyme related to lactoylglutathione lyase
VSPERAVNARNPIFIHYVHDMARARRFYESVFGVTPSFASRGWTTLDFGAFELALHILSPGHTDESPLPHAGLNLQVDLIEDVQARIEAHGGELLELREPQSNVPDRVATFRDSEGNGFELRQHVG